MFHRLDRISRNSVVIPLNKVLLFVAVFFSAPGNTHAGDCQTYGHYEGHIIDGPTWDVASLLKIDAVINSKMHCDIDLADERRVLEILLKESICSNVYGIKKSILGKLATINSGQPQFEYLVVLKKKSPSDFDKACKVLESVTWPANELIPILFSHESYVPERQQQQYTKFWDDFNKKRHQISNVSE